MGGYDVAESQPYEEVYVLGYWMRASALESTFHYNFDNKEGHG